MNKYDDDWYETDCYECTAYGDDYYIDDDGEIKFNCDDCYVLKREEDD